MSRQAGAKAAQGWKKKPDTCAGCKHFTMDRIEEPDKWIPGRVWAIEKNLRCSLGGFKTGKSNTCDRFAAAVQVVHVRPE